MIQKKSIAAGLLGVGLILSCIATTPAHAVDLALRYQILSLQQGSHSANVTFKLQLINLTDHSLTQVSIGILSALSSDAMTGRLVLDELTSGAPRVLTSELTVPVELSLQADSPLRFYIDYESPDGRSYAAVIQGEPTVFAGEVSP